MNPGGEQKVRVLKAVKGSLTRVRKRINQLNCGQEQAPRAEKSDVQVVCSSAGSQGGEERSLSLVQYHEKRLKSSRE